MVVKRRAVSRRAVSRRCSPSVHSAWKPLIHDLAAHLHESQIRTAALEGLIKAFVVSLYEAQPNEPPSRELLRAAKRLTR